MNSSSKRAYRIFVAFAKREEPEVVTRVTAEVRTAALARLTAGGVNLDTLNVQVISSADAWGKVGMSLGGFDAWASYVAKGLDSLTREPNFHAIVIPWQTPFGYGVLGKATAMILAINEGKKPVRAYSDGALYDITGMDEMNPKDFTSGWVVRCPDLEGMPQGGGGGPSL